MRFDRTKIIAIKNKIIAFLTKAKEVTYDLHLLFKTLPFRTRLIIIVVFFLSATFFGISIKNQPQAKKSFYRKGQTNARNIVKFIDQCLEALNSIYRVGHNYMLLGMKETRTWTNDFKDITNVQLSVDLYVARGYFERFREDLDNVEPFSQASEDIKELLNRAAAERIEAVNLYTSGFLLKEQIGKTLLNNFLTDKNKLKALPIPTYHGEVEEGLSKIPLANSFLVEALEKIKLVTDEAKLGHFYDSTIASLIGYYSEAIETEFDSYIREGRNSLDDKNYYQAIIAYSKALRIKAQDKDSFLALAQAYTGIGDKEKAEGVLTHVKQIYPEDKIISDLGAAVNPLTKPQ